MFKSVRAVLGSPWVRVAGTLAGVALLLHTVDIPTAVASLGHADPRWIAAALGLTASQVEDALRRANETPGPALVELVIEQEANVFPMIVPGGSLSEPLEAAPV